MLLAVIAAVILITLGSAKRPGRENIGSLLVVCAGVVFGFPLFTALAMRTEAAAHGGVVLGILPLATALAGSVVSGERPSGGFWVAAVLGCVLVVSFSIYSGSGTVSIGDLYLLAAVGLAAIGYAYGASLSRVLPAGDVICWAIVLSAPLVVPASMLLIDWTLLSSDSLGENLNRVWFSLLYLGLVSQLGGFLLWYQALSLDGVARTSQLQLLQPFFTLLAAAIFLQEIIDLTSVVFAISIVSTVFISRKMAVIRAL